MHESCTHHSFICVSWCEIKAFFDWDWEQQGWDSWWKLGDAHPEQAGWITTLHMRRVRSWGSSLSLLGHQSIKKVGIKWTGRLRNETAYAKPILTPESTAWRSLATGEIMQSCKSVKLRTSTFVAQKIPSSQGSMGRVHRQSLSLNIRRNMVSLHEKKYVQITYIIAFKCQSWKQACPCLSFYRLL